MAKNGIIPGDKPHSKGGIDVIVKDTNQLIEVESKEYQICKSAMDSKEILYFTNKTNIQILDSIHKKYNCPAFDKTAQSGDFIVCKIAVADDKPRRRVMGTASQIVNAINGLAGGKVEGETAEVVFEKGGTILLAPNGKPSNLTAEQYKLVRTPEFLNWFGNWIEEPEKASKVVDSNGEPLVVFHGTQEVFFEFNKEKIGTRTKFPTNKLGFFFTGSKQKALKLYANFDKNKEKKIVLNIFLNIRNPFYTKSKDFYKNDEEYKVDRLKQKLKGNDGIICYSKGLSGFSDEYVAFHPNQIKLADGSNTTFDPNNDDIRFEQGGTITDKNKETYEKWKSLVNMSKSELKAFYDSKEGKKAGLTQSKANKLGIDSGRESARMIMKMKDTSVSDWTPTMWKWANKQISFIRRMSGNKGSLYDDNGNKTRKHTSLLIWGHNPEKYEKGGSINGEQNNDIIQFKLYDVQVGGNSHTESIYDGYDLDEAKRYFNRADLDDLSTSDKYSGGLVILQEKVNKYKYIYQDEDMTIKDYPIEDYYDDDNIYELIEEGEYVDVETRKIIGENDIKEQNEEQADELLNETINYFKKLYPRYTKAGYVNRESYYFLIPIQNTENTIELRISNHSPNFDNIDSNKYEILKTEIVRLGENPKDIDVSDIDFYDQIYDNDMGFVTYRQIKPKNRVALINCVIYHTLDETYSKFDKNTEYNVINEYFDLNKQDYELSDITEKIEEIIQEQIDEYDGNETIFKKGGKISNELKKGIKVEKEHKDTAKKLYNHEITPDQAPTEIAKDHIDENPNYYDDLEDSGITFENGGSIKQPSNKQTPMNIENIGNNLEQFNYNKIYYHGTNQIFDKFDTYKFGKGEGSNKLGEGIYLTTNLEKAKEYGHIILEVVLKNNLRLIDYDQVKYEDGFYDYVDKLKTNDEKINAKQNFARLKFDGLLYGSNEVIIFDINNVKILGKSQNENQQENDIKNETMENETKEEVMIDNNLSNRANNLLANSLSEYESSNDEQKKKYIAHIKEQLALNDKGEESIGFGLDKDMVDAGKEFLKIVEKDNLETNEPKSGLREEYERLENIAKKSLKKDVKRDINRANDDLFNFVEYNPSFYPDFFRFMQTIPNKYKLGANPYQTKSWNDSNYEYPNIANWMKENNKTIFDFVDVVQYPLPKYKPFEINHEDKVFMSIHDLFTSRDDLRPAFMGSHFSEYGVTSTDAHKMLFTKYRGVKSEKMGNYCFSKKCFTMEKSVEDARFPDWFAVVPFDNNMIVSLNTEYLYSCLKNLINLGVLDQYKASSIALQIGDVEDANESSFKVVFNAKLFLECLEAMVKLGHKDLEMSYSKKGKSNSPYMIFPKGNSQKINGNFKLETDFSMIMPILNSFEDENGLIDNVNYYYNIESNCVSVNEIKDAYCFDYEVKNKAIIENQKATINKIEKDVEKIKQETAEREERLAKENKINEIKNTVQLIQSIVNVPMYVIENDDNITITSDKLIDGTYAYEKVINYNDAMPSVEEFATIIPNLKDAKQKVEDEINSIPKVYNIGDKVTKITDVEPKPVYNVVGHVNYNKNYGWETMIENGDDKVVMFENTIEPYIEPISEDKQKALDELQSINDLMELVDGEDLDRLMKEKQDIEDLLELL